MSQSVLIESVVKRYGDFKAVDHISIEVKDGEFFTLLGPSGCGKTTLLRMIAGFNSIDEGTISFGGQVINHLPAHKRDIGMVFQNYAIFPHMTVYQNVLYGLKNRRLSKQEMETRAEEAMHTMQIYEYRDRQPSQLSGGQQQRVALARAIVIRPCLLLMDEPLSNLDAKLRVEMRNSIRHLQKNLGITTIYVTHDQEEALAVSDRIAVMHSGVIEQLGTPVEIYSHPANRFVADFIGTSNFISGEVIGGRINIPGNSYTGIRCSRCEGMAVEMAFRPEYAELKSEECRNSMRGSVKLSTFLGDYISYEIVLEGGQTVFVNAYGEAAMKMFRPQDTVYVKVDPRKMMLFDEKSGKAIPFEAVE